MPRLCSPAVSHCLSMAAHCPCREPVGAACIPKVDEVSPSSPVFGIIPCLGDRRISRDIDPAGCALSTRRDGLWERQESRSKQMLPSGPTALSPAGNGVSAPGPTRSALGTCHTLCAAIPGALALSVPEYLRAVMNGDGWDITVYSCFTSATAPVSLSQLMWPFLIPPSVLDSYPLIFFLRTEKSCCPLKVRTDCLPSHASSGCAAPLLTPK